MTTGLLPPLGRRVPELPPMITREGSEYVLRCRVRLPRRREELFPFFSDARNLEKMTPELLHLTVLNTGEIEMKVGTIINYRLKIRGVPLKWRTQIIVWKPPGRFADLQLKGPYRQWIHEHTFVDEGETTLMQDTVRYKVPGGVLVHDLLVKRDVLNIFTYRSEVLAQLFPLRQEFGSP